MKQRNLFANVSAVSLTSDMWSDSRSRSYLTITVHYIENFLLKSSILAFSHFTGRHTGINIGEVIKRELEIRGLLEKCRSITCDGAFNAVKSCGVLGIERLRCIAHLLNLIIVTALALWAKLNQKKRLSNSATTTATTSSEAAQESDDEMDEESLSLYRRKIPRPARKTR